MPRSSASSSIPLATSRTHCPRSKVLLLDAEGAAIGAGKQGQIIDQACQMITLEQHLLHRFLLILLTGRCHAQLRRRAQDRERRAQLMRRVGDEVALAAERVPNRSQGTPYHQPGDPSRGHQAKRTGQDQRMQECILRLIVRALGDAGLHQPHHLTLAEGRQGVEKVALIVLQAAC